MNITEITAKHVEEPPNIIKFPVTIESPFFNSSPQISVNQKLIVSGQREVLLIQSGSYFMTYEDFSNINLTCRFYNIAKMDRIALSVPCYFVSPTLNVVSIEVKPYKLQQGFYNL